MSTHVISTIQRNAREQIRLAWDEYEGHAYLDLRVFYDDAPEWKPTRKGVTLKPSQVRELMSALQAAHERGLELGLITEGRG